MHAQDGLLASKVESANTMIENGIFHSVLGQSQHVLDIYQLERTDLYALERALFGLNAFG